MSENIEFISAKDLPEATGEEVSVICLENGEMKQKPGASLGGGEWDIVLDCGTVENADPSTINWDVMSVPEDAYDIALNKLRSGKRLLILLTWVVGDENGDLYPTQVVMNGAVSDPSMSGVSISGVVGYLGNHYLLDGALMNFGEGSFVYSMGAKKIATE